MIQIHILQSLKTLYNRDIRELIEMYLQDAKNKIDFIKKNLEKSSFPEMLPIVKELRIRSAEIGAIHFSHFCLLMEIAIQEMRYSGLNNLMERLELNFQLVHKTLLEIQNPEKI